MTQALEVMKNNINVQEMRGDPYAWYRKMGGKKKRKTKRKSLKKNRKSKRRKSLKKKQRKTKRKGRR